MSRAMACSTRVYRISRKDGLCRSSSHINKDCGLSEFLRECDDIHKEAAGCEPRLSQGCHVSESLELDSPNYPSVPPSIRPAGFLLFS